MDLIALLKQQFGFDGFKTGQREVIEKLLSGRSASAIFPTGSGKSLCYQLTATQLPNLTLVVSPLLSLMKDQLDFLLSHRIKAARLDSTLERSEYNQVLQQAKSGSLKVLMISVERFKNERFRAQLQQMNISLMVIDEAHCISEWGHNFRPDYLKLPQYQKQFNIKQTLLLTATATPQVIQDMRNKFNIATDDVVITGFYRSNLKLVMKPTAANKRSATLLEDLTKTTNKPSIVYVTLQKTAEEVAEFLHQNQLPAQHYHAGMKADEREHIQNQFMGGEINCIVATIAFGMGIDKTNVRQVFHYDLPKSIENYAQEIGRAGRDGLPSRCTILANNENLQVQENFVYGDTPEEAAIANLLEQIKNCQSQNSHESFWETKLTSLSNELNIRPLPLKTLLVYLELEGIITPKFTYFEEYAFKSIDNTEQIINLFQGERKAFIQALFDNCVVKKTWTYVDIQGILDNDTTGGNRINRSRILTALEWLEDQGHLELQAKLAVERFDVTSENFDVTPLTQKLYQLFLNKEHNEINRIHNMIAMFESDQCLSKQMANYFGDQNAPNNCGHCSVCENGAVCFQSNQQLPELNTMDCDSLLHACKTTMASAMSTHNATKFLCGIHTPIFTRLKVRSLPNFGALEKYPFQAVKHWLHSELDC
ncbi:RecQ family ATP-dependent DNA helicase [Marinicella sp. S1101]|uniref:RecQ family ATP-dependent DNA helicase n=1 Tax=Marinicella marina TaxID=2996016 RepID=UPI002260AF1E|nr:RecQ family ATP-dependent DNA helicase [Marinicella marina]MCX7554525.1 RecQ family ATP-dependent DNA helicase [Marinicella marina]MDJ1140676.1 RecQ family ATP-dependent DNA helicase [Marinicella marina]